MPVAELRALLSLSGTHSLGEGTPIHLPLWVHSWSPKDLSPEAVATGGQAILSVMISQRPSTVTHASDPSIPLGEAGMANLRLI